MQTLQQTYNPTYLVERKRQSILSQFFSWCNSQEQFRFGWLAVILAVHGCVLSPMTVLLVAASGNSMVLWGFAIGAMAMCLVTNLAAMPTKVTIPVFFISIVIDLGVIAASIGLMYA